MQPVNSKSLLSFIFNQMEKLDRKEILVEEANAQANLSKQANNLLTYELKRAEVSMKLATHNHENPNNKIELRQVESKTFDNNTMP